MPWLFFAYPLLSHIATYVRSERLACLAMTVFVAVPLLPVLRRARVWAWVVLLAVAAFFYGCALLGAARLLMYLPPVLLPASVLFVFARSLKPGRTPIVTQVATQIRGTLPHELAAYTRRVTQFWVALLATLALSSALLALLATPEVWSLATNGVQYIVLALAFVGEYLLRRVRFRQFEHESFAAMVMALVKTRVV
jgi:uncharacterized membrane protein